MSGLKVGWIIPAIILFVLIAVIGVGIYQLNADGNPWYFGDETVHIWEFLSKE